MTVVKALTCRKWTGKVETVIKLIFYISIIYSVCLYLVGLSGSRLLKTRFWIEKRARCAFCRCSSFLFQPRSCYETVYITQTVTCEADVVRESQMCFAQQRSLVSSHMSKIKAGWSLCCWFIVQSAARKMAKTSQNSLQIWPDSFWGKISRWITCFMHRWITRSKTGWWRELLKLKELGVLTIPSLAPLKFQYAYLKNGYVPSCWADVELAVNLRQHLPRGMHRNESSQAKMRNITKHNYYYYIIEFSH